jgi:hypothetical protein
MNQRLLCIYHAQCDDGFGAAWAVRHAFNAGAERLQDFTGVDFWPAVHAGKVPDVVGRHVLMVDFVYPAKTMEKLIDGCRSMLVLDHHKSSMLDVREWAAPKVADRTFVAAEAPERFRVTGPKFDMLFDMSRSGAMMAWDHYHPGVEPPNLIKYIQDHDLWAKKLDRIDEFTAGLRSYPMEFEVWDEFAHWSPFEQLLVEGVNILRYKRQLVDIAVKNSFWVEIEVPGQGLVVDNEGSRPALHRVVRVRGANVPPAIASEVGEALALRYGGISLTWVEGYKWIYSLRSRAVGDQPAEDVSLIAKAMGGGGHAQAAGFKSMTPVHRKAMARADAVDEEAP